MIELPRSGYFIYENSYKINYTKRSIAQLEFAFPYRCVMCKR